MPVARPRCCAVVTIKAPRSPQIIEGIAHARRHLCQLQIQEVPDLRMPEAMHGSSRFEHRPRPHCPQGSTVWQPLFPFSVWQSMIAADLQLALLWREASMAADQSQACTRTHAQQPHNCRFPSAPSLRKLVGKVQHTSAHRLPGVCAGRRFAQGICSHTSSQNMFLLPRRKGSSTRKIATMGDPGRTSPLLFTTSRSESLFFCPELDHSQCENEVCVCAREPAGAGG